MKREYYGGLEDCRGYIEDKNHKAVVWKECPFSFELKNSTKYTLEIKKEHGSDIFTTIGTIKAEESIQIHYGKCSGGKIVVFEKGNQKCSFCIDSGCMVERNLVDTIEKGKTYIAPIFRQGIVEIVACTDCSPNFGIIPKYNVKPLEFPDNVIKVSNKTSYNIIISMGDTVIQRIESGKIEELGVPTDGIIYIDTETEEVKWKDMYDCQRKKILRVNGCCIEIKNGKYYKSYIIGGPGSSEPYINHFYVTKEDTGISVWCNTIDYRID